MRRLLVVVCVAVVAAPAAAQLSDTPVIRYRDVTHPQLGDAGMVATQNRYASETGARILERGGNAVDAAVATALAMAVTWPTAGNIGGGGVLI